MCRYKILKEHVHLLNYFCLRANGFHGWRHHYRRNRKTDFVGSSLSLGFFRISGTIFAQINRLISCVAIPPMRIEIGLSVSTVKIIPSVPNIIVQYIFEGLDGVESCRIHQNVSGERTLKHYECQITQPTTDIRLDN